MSADTAALPAAPRPRTPALPRLRLTELTLFLRERQASSGASASRWSC